MKLFASGLSAGLAASITGLIWGEPPPKTPHVPYAVTPVMQEVRAFQRLGDEVVAGIAGALERRQAARQAVAAKLAAAPLSAWASRGDSCALLSFVLAGGDAGVLRDILRRNAIAETMRPAAMAVLAFAERRLEQARSHFANVDFTTLPDELASAMEVARAAALAERAPDDAVAALESAYIKQPATLAEASALRLIATTRLAKADVDGALAAMRYYYRRFPASPFNEQNGASFAEGLAQLAEEKLAPLVADFARDVESVAKGAAAPLMLELAWQTLFKGRTSIAAIASRAALNHAGDDLDLVRRARLYLLAAEAATGASSDAVASLASAPREGLTASERELLDAAIAIARQVTVAPRSLPVRAAKGPVAAPKSAPPPASRDRFEGLPPTLVQKSKAILEAGDAALSKGRKP